MKKTVKTKTNLSLFEEPTFPVRLWDDKRKRVILTAEMTEEQIKLANEWFQPTCGHLRYEKEDGC